MKKLLTRFTDRNKLSYVMNIAFGICLLALMLFFQFGYQLGERRAEPFLRQENTPAEQKLLLIDEPNPLVRGTEIAIAIGMIVLGSERLIIYKRRKSEKA